MLPPMHYQGQPPAGGYGYPPGQGSPAPPMQAGHVRSADEMDGGADAAPPAKRQRVAKLPGGQLYPEADWIAMHPVSEDSIREMIVLIGILVPDLAPSTAAQGRYETGVEAGRDDGHAVGAAAQPPCVDAAGSYLAGDGERSARVAHSAVVPGQDADELDYDREPQPGGGGRAGAQCQCAEEALRGGVGQVYACTCMRCLNSVALHTTGALRAPKSFLSLKLRTEAQSAVLNASRRPWLWVRTDRCKAPGLRWLRCGIVSESAVSGGSVGEGD